MAASKRVMIMDIAENGGNRSDEESSGSGSDDSVGEVIRPENANEEVLVDFEARYPIDSDANGIQQLLHQLFLQEDVNIVELADVIIRQNHVGSVMKQVVDLDDEDNDQDQDDVYGLTTVINLTEKKNVDCVNQLRVMLLENSSRYAGEENAVVIKSILEDDENPVGLLINERFINLPPLVCVPFLAALSQEIKRAVRKKMPYRFTYLVLICKLQKLKENQPKKNKKNVPDLIWSNEEEEFIVDEADMSFEFLIKNNKTSGLTGDWTRNDLETNPYRKILIFKAEKLDPIIAKLDRIINKKQ